MRILLFPEITRTQRHVISTNGIAYNLENWVKNSLDGIVFVPLTHLWIHIEQVLYLT